MIEAVAERLEGALRHLRRRGSDEFKARAVAEALEPGECLGDRASSRHSPVAALWLASCGLGDAIVRARADVSEEHLQRVIRAVRSA